MYKFTYGIMGVTIFMYLSIGHIIKIDFFIKCAIILFSLIAHIYAHKIVSRIFGESSDNSFFRKYIIAVSGGATNLIIALVLFNFKFHYFRYATLINLTLGFVNLLPIYPFDGKDVLELICGGSFSDKMSNKIIKVVEIASISIVGVVGVLQVVLFSYNFSILVLFGLLVKFRKGLSVELIQTDNL